jgi:hypothetical protein
MKITVTKQMEEEVELIFPSFFEHGQTYFKVINEDKWIAVKLNDFSLHETLISVFDEKPCYWERIITGGKKITEEEFNKVSSQVKEKIKSFYE